VRTLVKTGIDRSAKTSAKYDPFVTMLRIKALQNSMKDKFQIPAVQQTYVDENVKNWASEMALPFGKTAVLSDLTKRYVWKLETMTDTAIQVMHLIFLSKGFTEEQYVQWLVKLYAKLSEIKTLYGFCKREPDRLFSQVEVSSPIESFPKLEISVMKV
jgi:hypothetical protein